MCQFSEVTWVAKNQLWIHQIMDELGEQDVYDVVLSTQDQHGKTKDALGDFDALEWRRTGLPFRWQPEYASRIRIAILHGA